MQIPYIIAEMAWGYTGEYSKAIQILKGVKESGANAIGIHLTNLPTYMVKDYKCSAGQTLSDSADDTVSIYSFLDQINMPNNNWIDFNDEANNLGIDLVVMCNDILSFELSKKMNVKKYVISAALFLELDLIKMMVLENNDIVLRAGGATLDEIESIVNFILSIDNSSKINILVGIQLYPTPINELHIASISSLREYFKNTNITFGLADHIDGDLNEAKYLPSLALPFGITTIEKHITTNRKEKLEDYEAALGIDQFKEFVSFIKLSINALGSGQLDYLINDSYKKYRDVVRKKIVATKDLSKGDVISRGDLEFKRSDSGEQIDALEKIIGKKVIRDINKDEGIKMTDLQ